MGQYSEFVETMKRLAEKGKLTADSINCMKCLTDDEKAYITAEVKDYEQAYKIVTGEIE